MIFEKEFPSLRFLQAEFNMITCISVGSEIWQEAKRNYHFVCVSDIEEHCLDKQRVREVFDDVKIRLLQTPFEEHPAIIERALKEELGL